MIQKLQEVLMLLDEPAYMELSHAINISSSIKNCCKRFDVSFEEFAERLEVTKEEFDTIIKGAYPFDLRIIFKIDALMAAIEVENTKKNFTPLISFPPYKYSRPLSNQGENPERSVATEAP